MKTENKTDLVEEAMKRAYREGPPIHEVSSDWQSSLMEQIRQDITPDDIETEKLEIKFLHLSWIAAGVAATFILVSGIIYSMQPDDFENDLHELYADSSLNNISVTMERQ